MASRADATGGRPMLDRLFDPVRWLVMLMAFLAGLGVLAMVAVTCLDVVLREMGRPLIGALDIVTLAGLVAIACALPYTTAIKGHVAIEFFFHKLGRRTRWVVDGIARLIAMGLFGTLCAQCIRQGVKLQESGQVTPTLQAPMFWTMHLLAFSCGVVVLVIAYHLVLPGKEMIRQ